MRLESDDLRLTTNTARQGLLTPWRVGAIVPALAVRDDANQLWLQVAGQRLAARLASPGTTGPAHGQLLQLQVLRTSPVLAVKVLADAGDLARKEVLDAALRRYLPRQESPAPLLANLQWLTTRPAPSPSQTSGLPDAVMQAVQRLWQSIPQAATLDNAQAVSQALRHSGLFLENALATRTAGPDRDLKAALLTLVQTLKNQGARTTSARAELAMHAPVPDPRAALLALRRAPATLAALDESQHLDELLRQTEGTLARLTSHQLASAESGASPLLLELPLRHDQHTSTLRLRIEREPRRQDTAADSWSLEAAMDLGIDGALHARVQLRGKRVGVQLRAESPALHARLAARTNELERLLQGAGLQPDTVVCLHGLPQTETSSPSRLLDLQA